MFRILAVHLTEFQMRTCHSIEDEEKNGPFLPGLKTDACAMSTMKLINLPLLALFALCYGLGHPALASLRPQVVDKTLASFHEDVNRTIVGSTISVAKLLDPAPVEMASVPVPQPVVLAIPLARSEPVQQFTQATRRLAELPRQHAGGFTVLAAR